MQSNDETEQSADGCKGQSTQWAGEFEPQKQTADKAQAAEDGRQNCLCFFHRLEVGTVVHLCKGWVVAGGEIEDIGK